MYFTGMEDEIFPGQRAIFEPKKLKKREDFVMLL